MANEVIDYKVNYYEVLNVPSHASSVEIKKAYYKLARDLHPDRNGDEEKFKLLRDAYQGLSDPQRRAAFDKVLKNNPLFFEKDDQSLGVVIVDYPSPFTASSSGSIANTTAIVSYKVPKYINLSALISRTDVSVSVLLSWTLKNHAFGFQLLQLPGQLRKQGHQAFVEFLIGFLAQIYQNPEEKQAFFAAKSIAFFLENIRIFGSEISFFATYWPEKVGIFIREFIEYYRMRSMTEIEALMPSLDGAQMLNLVRCCPDLAAVILSSSYVYTLTFSEAEFVAASLPQKEKEIFMEQYIEIRQIKPEEIALRQLVEQKDFEKISEMVLNPQTNFCSVLDVKTVFEILINNISSSTMTAIGILLIGTFILDEQAIKKIIAMDKKACLVLIKLLNQYLFLSQEVEKMIASEPSLAEAHVRNAVNAVIILLTNADLDASESIVDTLLERNLTKLQRGDEIVACMIVTPHYQEKLRRGDASAYVFAEQYQLWPQIEAPNFMEDVPLERITLWKRLLSGKISDKKVLLSLVELEEFLANFDIDIDKVLLNFDGDDAVCLRLLTLFCEKLGKGIANTWITPIVLRPFIREQLIEPGKPFHSQVAALVLRHIEFFLIEESFFVLSKDGVIKLIDWEPLINLYIYNNNAMSLFFTPSRLVKLKTFLLDSDLGKNYYICEAKLVISSAALASFELAGKKAGEQKKVEFNTLMTKGNRYKAYNDWITEQMGRRNVLLEVLNYLFENGLLENSPTLFRMYEFLHSAFFMERTQAFQVIEEKLAELISGTSSSSSDIVGSLISAIAITGYDSGIDQKLSQAMESSPLAIAIVCAKIKVRHDRKELALSTMAVNQLDNLLLIAKNKHDIYVEECDLELAKLFIEKEGECLSSDKIKVLGERFGEQLPELQRPDLQGKLQCHRHIESLLLKSNSFHAFYAPVAQLFEKVKQDLEDLIKGDITDLEEVPGIQGVHAQLLLIPKNQLPVVEHFVRSFPQASPHSLIQWLLALADTEEQVVDVYLLALWHRHLLAPNYLYDYPKLRSWYVKAILTNKISLESLSVYPEEMLILLAIDLYKQIHQLFSIGNFSYELLISKIPETMMSEMIAMELRDVSLQQKIFYEYWLSQQTLLTKLNSLIDALEKEFITKEYLWSHIHEAPAEVLFYLHEKLCFLLQRKVQEKAKKFYECRFVGELFATYLQRNPVANVFSKEEFLKTLWICLKVERKHSRFYYLGYWEYLRRRDDTMFSAEHWLFLVGYLDNCSGFFSSLPSYEHPYGSPGRYLNLSPAFLLSRVLPACGPVFSFLMDFPVRMLPVRMLVAMDTGGYSLRELLLLEDKDTLSSFIAFFSDDHAIPIFEKITAAGFNTTPLKSVLQSFALSVGNTQGFGEAQQKKWVRSLFFQHLLSHEGLLSEQLTHLNALFRPIIKKFVEHPLFLEQPVEHLALLQEVLSHQFFYNFKKQAVLFDSESTYYAPVLANAQLIEKSYYLRIRGVYSEGVIEDIVQAIYSVQPSSTTEIPINIINEKIQTAAHQRLTGYRSQYPLLSSWFKAFAGILIAIPALGVPLLFKAYRNYFFNALEVAIHLDVLQTNVARLNPQQPTKSWIEQQLNRSSTLSMFVGKSSAKQTAINELTQTISSGATQGAVAPIIQHWQNTPFQANLPNETHTNADVVAKHRFFGSASTPPATAAMVQKLAESGLKLKGSPVAPMMLSRRGEELPIQPTQSVTNTLQVPSLGIAETNMDSEEEQGLDDVLAEEVSAEHYRASMK